MSHDATDHSTNSRKPSFVERLAERVGVNASAKAVYSDPVEHDGVTVIPVAKVRWGFGGGTGRKMDKSGQGGGGGVQVSPLGYIEMRDGETEYKPIRDPAAFAPLMVIGGLGGWILLRALRKLIRGT
jgi:uncharacterized spore protein YtfJ